MANANVGTALKLARPEVAKFRRSLLTWFRRHKRDLPWRRSKDPYRIWLSEIMLQQTRVAAVLPHYHRFVRSFPTVRALARARPDQVVRFWAVLGYYSRARNLHHAAQEIVACYGGRFPRELAAALRLPGVGRYTAAAVLSIAYGAPVAALDGNVARVLARLGAVHGELRSSQRWEELRSNAQSLLAVQAPGDWNQAMMELGATVCTPRAPRCHACPVSRWCRAYAQGIVEELPPLRRKRAQVKVKIAAAVLLDPRGRTLLLQNRGADSVSENSALFSRMWQFPAVCVSREARAELGARLRASLHIATQRMMPLPTARHSVTFREVTLAPFLVRVDRLPKVSGGRTPLLVQFDRLPVSSATRKIAAAALLFA